MTRELTDLEIGKIFAKWSDTDGSSYADLMRAAIAADRALRVPMTQPEAVEAFCKLPHDVQYVSVFEKGIRAAEAFHGIGEKT